MATVQRKCRVCGIAFAARQADIDRGWAKHCSKSCAAKTNNRKTGNYARYQRQKAYSENRGTSLGYESADDLPREQ
jgi:hypothetical protein